jgi:hypothetical protein
MNDEKDLNTVQLNKHYNGIAHMQKAMFFVMQELEFDRYITCTINTGDVEILIGARKAEKKNDSV